MIVRKAVHFACIALAALLASTPAQAIFRAYLTSDGNDANPCTLPSPCRLLPAALAAVDPGGEIWMLDSANYNTGQVSVTKSVTILAVPGSVGSLVATGGGSALSVGAPGIRVALRNLVFVQIGASYAGVFFTDGLELSITQCDFSNLSGIGGAIASIASGGVLTVTDTRVRNSNYAIVATSNTYLTIERTRLETNQLGVYAGNARLTMSDSVLAGNNTGVNIYAGTANFSNGTVRNSTITGSSIGVNIQTSAAGDFAWATLTNTALTNNATAINISASAGATTNLMLDGNSITNNTTPIQVSGTPTINTRGNNTIKHNTANDNITPLTTGWAGQ